MEASGVRSSCETLMTKSLRMRSSFSSCSCSRCKFLEHFLELFAGLVQLFAEDAEFVASRDLQTRAEVAAGEFSGIADDAREL